MTISTSSVVGIVEACSDGAYGNFVAWQDGSVLKVMHVMESGDLDPNWPPAGALASNVAIARPLLGVLPDRLGGVYAWWKEGTDFYVTRLDATGAIAAGWSARGRLVDSVRPDIPKPSVIEDGTGGLYAVWSKGEWAFPDGPTVMGIHLAPDNTGAGGWPNAPLALKGLDLEPTLELWPAAALAPDGIYVAWGSWSAFELGSTPSVWQLRRFAADGSPHPAWPTNGLDFGSSDLGVWGDASDPVPQSALISISPDNRGGVFVLTADPTSQPCCPGSEYIAPVLRRLTGDATPAEGWTASGMDAAIATWFVDAGIDGSIGVLSDGLDAGFVLRSSTDPDAPVEVMVARVDALGNRGSFIHGLTYGHEVVPNGNSGAFLASFKGYGPSSPFDHAAAQVRLDQLLAPPGWPGWNESHPEQGPPWYGDIALASSGDGGVVFFWTQRIERIGLFARRFGPGGGVTDVAPTAGPRGLRSLRFVSGAGVRASFDLGSATIGRFDLFDLAGRRLASSELRETGEVVLPGTAELTTGVYFGRLLAGGESFVGRVAVTR